jgi:hypothetical protein
VGKRRIYLTNQKYRDLLWIIGTSPKPLTTYEIKERLEEKKEFAKTKSPYVYEMVKNLYIDFRERRFKPLFNWNKFPNEENHKNRLINYLKDSLKIDFDYNLINISKNSNNIITIELESDKKILMKKDSLQVVHATFLDKNIKQKSFNFFIKYKNQICIPNLDNSSLDSFIDLSYTKSILFLDKELKPKYQKLVNQKREIYKNLSDSQPAKKELNCEIEEIFGNNRLYAYSLNIRGLILYILAEIEDEFEINSKRQKSKRRKINHNSQISKVIENLATNYQNKFPFLYNYLEIRKIIDNSKHVEKHYEIKILKKIAKELKHQIHFDEKYSNSDLDLNNNTMINYWVAKRYFTEIYSYFNYVSLSLTDDNNNEFMHRVRDYKKRMLTLMKEYLEKEQVSLRNLLYEF